jgi:hypothetical protein
LPWPSERDNPDVERALGAPSALRDQVKLLQQELIQIRDQGLTLPPVLADQAKEAVKLANDWAVKEQLLSLFAEKTLFINPSGAADWLAKIHAQFIRATTPEVKALIRLKVQEFCQAFIPTGAALDDVVLLNGKEQRRQQITVEFTSTEGKRETTRLTAQFNGVNEFNVAKRYPGPSTRVVVENGEFFPDQLKPTPLSQSAELFVKARTELESGTSVPKWSVKSIEGLKNTCNSLAVEVNKLKDAGPRADRLHLWDRLTSLAQGAASYPLLFQSGP